MSASADATQKPIEPEVTPPNLEATNEPPGARGVEDIQASTEEEAEALEEIKNMKRDFEERLRALSGVAGKSNVVTDDVDIEQTSNGELQVKRLNCMSSRVDADQGYKLLESSWDASLLIGIGVSLVDSIILTILLFLNCFLQFFFAYIIQSRVVKQLAQGFTEETMQRLLEWRLGPGHSVKYWDPVTDTSLVTRVCSNYEASIFAKFQIDNVSNMEDYLGDSYGTWLARVAITIWLMLIIRDILGNYTFTTALLSVPRGRVTKLHLSKHKEKAKLKTIACFRLLYIIAGVSVPRLALAVYLGYSGCHYLVQSVSLSDTILNSVALGFVLEIDELSFQLAPKNSQAIIEKLMPIKRHKFYNPGTKYLDVKSVAALALLGATAFAISWGPLWEMRKDVVAAHTIMCGGVTNFVWAEDAATGIIKMSETRNGDWLSKDYDLSKDNRYLFKTMLQHTGLMSSPQAAETPLSDYAAIVNDGNFVTVTPTSIQRVQAMFRETFQEALAIKGCEDIDVNSSFRDAMDHKLSGLGLDGLNCSQLVPNCSISQVRVFCPATCRCKDALSGRWNSEGCSRRCMEDLETQTRLYTDKSILSGDKCADLQFVDQGSRWFHIFLKELEHELVEKGLLVDSGGNRTWSASFMDQFSQRTNDEWRLTNTTIVDLVKWMRPLLAGDSRSCEGFIVLDKMFMMDLCARRSNFDARRGSVAAFCPDTCGFCNLVNGTDDPVVQAQAKTWKEVEEFFQDKIKFNVIEFNNRFESNLFSGSSSLCDQGVISRNNFDEEDSFGQPSGDVTFGLVVPEDGNYSVYMRDNMDGFLTVVDSDTGRALGESDEYCSNYNHQLVQFSASQGQKLVIVAEGFYQNEGCFQLRVECPSAILRTNWRTAAHCDTVISDYGEDIPCALSPSPSPSADDR